MTIYDIATKAGVSISTVSRVLNNPDRVSAKTRNKVLSVIKRCNYAPNAMARGLVSSSMKTIGILASDILNYHFGQTASALENHFFNWGYSVILCNTGNKSDKKKDYIRILAEKKVDGVIFVGSVFTDIDIEESIAAYMPLTPVVVANSSLAIPNVHYVWIEHEHGLDLAVRHLMDRGHRRIVYVASSATFNGKRKIAGFFDALRRHDLPSSAKSAVTVPFGLTGAEEAVAGLLACGRNRATAMIFADDVTALCAVRTLKAKGLSIPGDMAVVAFDNSSYCLYTDPTMTSIDTKNETFAFLVANMLNDILSGGDVGTSVSLTPDLVIREST